MSTTTFFFFALFSSCSSASSQKQQLRISFNSSPPTADPGTCGDLFASSLSYLLYDGLYRFSNGKPEPALAERVEISRDRLTYTFHLRKSEWCNGTPLTAYDFERSWKRVLNPKFPAVWPSLFYPIKNAEKAHKGLIPPEMIEIRALNNLTLKVVLERPTPYFLALTTFPCYLPAPFEAEQKLAVPVISNGPFFLQESIPQSKIILTKNPRFWNAEQIKLDEIDIEIIPCEATALRMFESGDLDLIGGMESPFPLDSLEDLRQRYSFSFSSIPATSFCSFNTRHPLLKNKNLRKALSYAIDRDSIVKNITQMEEIAATRPIPPPLVDATKRFYPSFNPEEAQKFFNLALEELNLKREEIKNLSLLFTPTEIYRKIAATITNQWENILGISVSLESCEKQTLRDRLFKNNYDLGLYFWIAQFEDPVSILERFLDSENMKNTPHWTSEAYRDILQRAYAETNEHQRQTLLENAEELFCEEMPLAPIYHWSNGWICQPSIHQVTTMPGGLIQFERIVKDSSLQK